MRIKSISEAFSMRPITLLVHQESLHGKPNEFSIKEINIEFIKINGHSFQYCVGYDFNSNKMFEYRREAVNISYEIYKKK